MQYIAYINIGRGVFFVNENFESRGERLGKIAAAPLVVIFHSGDVSGPAAATLLPDASATENGQISPEERGQYINPNNG